MVKSVTLLLCAGKIVYLTVLPPGTDQPKPSTDDMESVVAITNDPGLLFQGFLIPLRSSSGVNQFYFDHWIQKPPLQISGTYDGHRLNIKEMSHVFEGIGEITTMRLECKEVQ